MTARSLLRQAVTTLAVTAAAAGAVVASAPPAAAAEPHCTTSWTGGAGTWSDPAHWSSAAAPGPDDVVCILRPDGGVAPAVTVTGPASAATITLVGSTLRLPAASTVLTVDDLDVEDSLVSGLGTVQTGRHGTTRFGDARVTGIALLSDGALFLHGSLAFRGGARIVQSPVFPLVVFDGDVRVVDADHDPANHLTVSSHNGEIAARTTVTIEVPFRYQDSIVQVSGTLRLPRFDNLDGDGVLTASGDELELYVAGGAIELARPITRIGPRVSLYVAGGIRAPDGTDALRDLVSIAGNVEQLSPLTLTHPLEVDGLLEVYASSLRAPGMTVGPTGRVVAGFGFPSGPTLTIPVVTVELGGEFTASHLTGRLQSAGGTFMSASHLGALRLSATAVSGFSLVSSATIDRTARLAGQASVPLQVRGLPADGGRVVLLTANGGIAGTFSKVVTSPSVRGTVTLDYTPTQVIAVYHAPVAARV